MPDFFSHSPAIKGPTSLIPYPITASAFHAFSILFLNAFGVGSAPINIF